jgi:hypothetical protein
VLGAAVELVAPRRMGRRLGLVAGPLHTGYRRQLLRVGKALSIGSTVLAIAGHRSRAASTVAGAAFLGAAIRTRFGILTAGMNSSREPKYTVAPQRERLAARQTEKAQA